MAGAKRGAPRGATLPPEAYTFSDRPWENGSIPIPYGTPESAIQAIVVFISPVNVVLIDFLIGGVTDREALREAIEVCLGLELPPVEITRRLDALVHTGLARRGSDGTVSGIPVDLLCWRMNEVARHLDLLEGLGDSEHATDCRDALDAAADAGRLDPARRERARAFSRSEAGRRVMSRYDDRTLGFPPESHSGEGEGGVV